MLKYKKIENSLLHTIVHLASKRRILMRKTKEKQRNITNQGKAVADIKETDDRKQADFIMLPTVDFCFKEMMHNKNVRKGIIAAILNVHPDEVEDTQLLPIILRKESEDDKYGILDVRVKLKSGTQMDFEMQVIYYDYWANRTIYYLSKMYSEQLNEGDGYDNIQKCIQVSILNHVLISEDDKYYRRIAFCDTQTGKEYSDMMEIHLLELPKLPPEQQSETDLIQWMRFLSGKNREDLKRMAEKNSNLQEAYNELDRLSADKKKRLEYEARQKAIRDKNILLKTGENRGIEKGERIGFEKGTQATLEKLILSMLKEQLPLDKISSITGESLEAIQTLGKKYGLL